MFELHNAEGDQVEEYATLSEARAIKEMYQDENPDNYYTIYKVIRTRVE